MPLHERTGYLGPYSITHGYKPTLSPLQMLLWRTTSGNCQPQIQFGGGAPLQITIFIPVEQGLQFLGIINIIHLISVLMRKVSYFYIYFFAKLPACIIKYQL